MSALERDVQDAVWAIEPLVPPPHPTHSAATDHVSRIECASAGS